MSQTSSRKQPEFKALEQDFWFAGCLDRPDIERAHKQGFAAVINILPEDDELCRMSDAEARATCEHYGMTYRHMPVYGHQLTNESIASAFAALVANTSGPRLVYCRSGMRVAFLWGMIRAAELGVEAVMERVAGVGFDISVIEDELIATAERSVVLGNDARVA
jgi:uncharacterized protein (TIGR01244 family)